MAHHMSTKAKTVQNEEDIEAIIMQGIRVVPISPMEDHSKVSKVSNRSMQKLLSLDVVEAAEAGINCNELVAIEVVSVNDRTSTALCAHNLRLGLNIGFFTFWTSILTDSYYGVSLISYLFPTELAHFRYLVSSIHLLILVLLLQLVILWIHIRQ